MSSGIRKEGEERRPVTLTRLAEMHEAGEPIAMITAYDFPSAQVIEEAGADIVLVGDSAANCVLGYDSTVPVGMDEMTMLAKAVRRGLTTPFLVGDLPFGSYEGSDELAIASAQRLVKEAGCDAVKLEGGGTSVERAKAIIDAGIPVMGHVGLTPQTATALGGMKAQGRTAERAIKVAEDAIALDQAGCFAVVIEAVPEAVSEMIVAKMTCPTIGIGAGNATSGQVLVLHDLTGINHGHVAKFVKRYSDVRSEMLKGVEAYIAEVRDGSFPAPEHVYSVDPSELEGLQQRLNREDLEHHSYFESTGSWDWEPLS
ncbi:MAG TPA: 3-methyl-2-oxobutanoate hydroxymethyltransferase [Solirubrobacterales bacterium]|nr:3-methyl-2-oxobutanoate hydroxymethyltransferase [Solirubrobacterales bacterium]HMU27848.1 3-methyl-2-oxobutanoate hydroxymethyltransferase [Solirubrobacterales bacterium]HMX71427.1 3-methyl-2-oxobutanoate hydroxymethyltransferase [Solirubrobacterales bacterium]HNA24801.1 3-methyl-2-oxobutanoate hydroxymethyltransferase [Solirubrobacterales bacterium]HNA44479.1 3-methyl-2-oxobutanoate hydroxymethyltransferase [Solirubrobacterales bacterium]